MNSFLEFVAQELMGAAAHGAMWHCPFHADDTPSFSIRPPKLGFKVRYKCFGCGAWGDEFDLLRHFYPQDDYGDRLERRRKLLLLYEAACSSFSGDRGGEEQSHAADSSRQADRRGLDEAWNNVTDELSTIEVSMSYGLQLLELFVTECKAKGVTAEDLLTYRRDFEAWKIESEERHLAGCRDPNCEARVCCAARDEHRQRVELYRRETDEICKVMSDDEAAEFRAYRERRQEHEFEALVDLHCICSLVKGVNQALKAKR